jgi:hypothetical protein
LIASTSARIVSDATTSATRPAWRSEVTVTSTRRPGRVLARVGQALLNDPVDGPAECRGQLADVGQIDTRVQGHPG